LIRFALDALLKGIGAPAARGFLLKWFKLMSQQKQPPPSKGQQTEESLRNKESNDMCGGDDAEAKLQALYKSSWENAEEGTAIPEIITLDTAEGDGSPDASGLPVPSATVNGRLFVEKAVNAQVLGSHMAREVDKVAKALQEGGTSLDVEATDSDIAAWQYGIPKDKVSVLMSTYHPAIKARPRRYVALPPAQVSHLSGTYFHQPATPSAELITNVLLLADPQGIARHGDPDPGISVTEVGKLLETYARHAATQQSRKWFLGVAVAGNCVAAPDAIGALGAPLGLAGAMRRCLAAATKGKTGDRAAALLGVAQAWQKVSPEIAKAADEKKAAALMLEACKPWATPTGALVDEIDANRCAAQNEVQLELGPVPAGSAAILVNGRKYGPIFHEQDGVIFGASHISFAEELELVYGLRLAGEKGNAFAKISEMLKIGDGEDDALRLGYAMAVRAQAVDKAMALRVDHSGGAEEEEDDDASARRVAAEYASDEHGQTYLSKAFDAAPDSLKVSVPCKQGLACPFKL